MRLRLVLLVLVGIQVVTVPTALANGGFFTFGSDIGHVHDIGTVVEGSRITVDLFALQVDLEFTCPVRANLIIVRQNNFNTIHRISFRRNAANSRIVMPRARFTGDAMLVIQSQNILHLCVGAADVVVEEPDAFARDPSRATETSDQPPQAPRRVDPSEVPRGLLLGRPDHQNP